MAINAAIEGSHYRMPGTHVVSRAEVVEFARAVRARDVVHLDFDAARARGYTDVVAPPTFAVTVAQRAEAEFMQDPKAQVDFTRLVHGEEAFTHQAPIVAGDELTAQTLVKRIRSAGGHDMVTLETSVETVTGEPRTTTTSVVVIRGESA